MSDFEKTAERVSAFQKIWGETLVKMVQSAVLPGQSYAPPEMLRQMRGTVFQALTQSWDEFMRSPEFLQTTKKWMDQTVKFRSVSNEFMSRLRSELQAPTRDDVEAVAFTVRGIEKRMESLAAELAEIKAAVSPGNKRRSPQRPQGRKSARKQRVRKAAVDSDRPSTTA